MPAPRKYSDEEIVSVFDSKGLTVLDGMPLKPGQKIRYRCRNNHEHSALFSNIRKGKGCGICNRNVHRTIEDVRAMFSARGWTCLSDTFNGVDAHLDVVCPQGHVGKKALSKFNKDRGCPVCSGKKKHTLAEVRAIVEEQGWSLLSTEFKSVNTAIRMRCPNGHVSSKALANFTNGDRCAVCSGLHSLTFVEMRESAARRGWEYVSGDYKIGQDILMFRCARGHVRSVKALSAVHGRACRDCLGLEIAPVEMVRECFDAAAYTVSTAGYKTARSVLPCVCPKGHNWVTTYKAFKRGTRCFTCACASRGEKTRLRYATRGGPPAAERKNWTTRYLSLLPRITKTTTFKKTQKTALILGYTPAQFSAHIQGHPAWQKLGDNGVYQIDHIFPVAAWLDYGVTDPRLVNALENLQPLTPQANRQKWDLYNHAQFENYLTNLNVEFTRPEVLSVRARTEMDHLSMMVRAESN